MWLVLAKLAAGAKELAKLLEDGLTTVSNGISQLNTEVTKGTDDSQSLISEHSS